MSPPRRAIGLMGSVRRALVATAVAAAVLVVLPATTSATASSGPIDQPAGSKVNSPANVNPGKTPVTDPSRITPDPSTPMTQRGEAQKVRESVAEDPNSRIACFSPTGALLTVAQVDRVDPSRPLTADQRAQTCANAPSPNRP